MCQIRLVVIHLDDGVVCMAELEHYQKWCLFVTDGKNLSLFVLVELMP